MKCLLGKYMLATACPQAVKETFFAPCEEIWVEMALKSSVNYKYGSETTLHQKYHDEIVAVKTAVWIITQ